MKKIIAISVLSLAFTPTFAQEVNNTMIDKLNTFINKLAETRTADEKESIKIMVEQTKIEVKTTENKIEDVKVESTKEKIEEIKTTENKIEDVKVESIIVLFTS